MYGLKKNGKVFTSKFVGNGASSYEKRIYRAAVSQRLRNTALADKAQHSQQTDIHAPGGIRSHNPSKRAVADPQIPIIIIIIIICLRFSRLWV